MRTSEKFEHQIRRIHELIEQPNTKVTWNEKIPDPDNPNQPRQIDITIRNNDHLTLVECRIHQEKQDVNWIEELLGRKQSLRADAIIAVSASGFTKGAIAKSKAFGIILRDFTTLSEEEIKSWGHSTKVKLIYYQYNDTKLLFTPAKPKVKDLTVDDIAMHLNSGQDTGYKIFETVSNKLDEKNFKGSICITKVFIDLNGVIINGQPIDRVLFQAKVKIIEQKLQIPSVVAYGAPDMEHLNRNAFVEVVELGNFEITRSTNEVIITIDLAPIHILPNCHFRFLDLEFDKTVHMTHIEIVGLPPMLVSLNDICIGVNNS